MLHVKTNASITSKEKIKFASSCEALDEPFCRRGFTIAEFSASGEWLTIASTSSTRQLNTLKKNGGWDGVS